MRKTTNQTTRERMAAQLYIGLKQRNTVTPMLPSLMFIGIWPNAAATGGVQVTRRLPVLRTEVQT